MGATWLQKEERWQRCVGGLIHRDNRGAEGRHNDVTPPLSVDAVWLNSGCLRCFFFVQRERKVSPVTEQDRLLLSSTDSRDTSVLKAEITTSHDRSNHPPISLVSFSI